MGKRLNGSIVIDLVSAGGVVWGEGRKGQRMSVEHQKISMMIYNDGVISLLHQNRGLKAQEA